MDGNTNIPTVLDVPALYTNGIEIIPDVYVSRVYAGPHEHEQCKVTDNSSLEPDHHHHYDHPNRVIRERPVNELLPEMECIDELVYLYRIMEHGSYISTPDISNNDTSIKGDTHIFWESIKSPFYSTWSFLGKRQSVTLRRRRPKYKRERLPSNKKKSAKCMSIAKDRKTSFKTSPPKRGKSEKRP
jgi:hypothetical protein